MNVIVRIQFNVPPEEEDKDWQDMRSLALNLTDNRESVSVTEDPDSPRFPRSASEAARSRRKNEQNKANGRARKGQES